MHRFILPVCILVACLTGSFTSTGAKKNNATVVRDCSGTYLRMQNDDYLVCNKEILTDIADGSMVEVRYKKVKTCPPTDEVVCMLYHDHKGIVQVTKVMWNKGTIQKKH